LLIFSTILVFPGQIVRQIHLLLTDLPTAFAAIVALTDQVNIGFFI